MFKRLVVFLCTTAFVIAPNAPLIAGTTGGIQGRIVDRASGAPLANVIVTVNSPSQSASQTTDAGGGYRFLSLAPDAYEIALSKSGYDPVAQAGISVFADQTQTVDLAMNKTVREIGRVTSRATSDYIKPGTTSDVYSVNAAGSEAAGGLGGPGGLNNAYSAIASVPGANVPQGQQGWYQGVSIRGGDIDQVGYELDGIPVNRAYDNAPQTMLSGLGQQELQVYTGGTPASADASGIAGYINQVIKTGSYPGYGRINGSVGSPAFYHRLSAEAGGATPDRHFSYYVGLAGVNQDFRYVDQNNGPISSNPLLFYPLVVTNANPNNSGFQYDGSVPAIFAPGNSYAIANTQSRDTVANVHIQLPHRGDPGNDDVQLLYLTSEVLAGYYSSQTDLGATNPATLAALNGGTPIGYSDTLVYNGPLMRPFNPGAFTTYYFPGSPTNRVPGTPGFNTNPNLSVNARDTNDNGVAVFKFQYQRNFNSRSYARLYGYTLYSNWFIDGPLSAFLNYGAEVADYEIPNHTRGINLSYANQINDKNLLTASASYTASILQRYSTTGGFPGSGNIALTNFADASGLCYDPTTGLQASCFSKGTAQGTINNPTPGALTAPVGTPGASAQWIATETGYHANLNQVHPRFTAVSLSDLWRPTDRLTFNLGVRAENYAFDLGDTGPNNAARQFFFNAYNRENCFAPGAPPFQAGFTAGVLNPCPSGTVQLAGSPFALVNASGGTQSNTVIQPRLGFTYQVSPDTVYRGSFGVYARPENSSWVQYNTTQNDLASFLGANFLQYGFTTPQHNIRPDVSYNYDLSLEHHVRGTDWSFKITPFYRSTRDQLQNFNISALTGLFSGLNVGHQISSGVELAIRKGDFSRDGFSGQLAYTYTRSRIKYGNFSNGANIIDNINSYIQLYNSYTSACVPAGAGGTYTSAQAQTCGIAANIGNAQGTFTNGGTVVANPYYNSTAQPILDRNAYYTTYDIIPAPFAGGNGYETPHVASLILNYKHDRFSITPSFTYSSGANYGSPLVWPGYVPQSCTGVTSGTTANPQTCSNFPNSGPLPALLIPDPYTGKFDGLGDFKEPSRLTMNLGMAYDAAKNTRISLMLTGLVDSCKQRGYAWDNTKTCVYSTLPSSVLPPVGNFAPLASTPVQLKYPYAAWLNNSNTGFLGSTLPFQATLNVQFKI